jgi:hypothetical protein
MYMGFVTKIKKFMIWGLALIGVLAIVSIVFASLNSARMSVSSNSFAPAMDMYGGSGVSETAYSQKATSREYASDDVTEASADDERQIIKTGSLELVVADVEASVEDLVRVAQDVGGYVTDRDVYESQGNKKRGQVTLRVPNESFEDVFAAAKAIAGKVTRESADTQDVTEEYVDLQAQLKNKQAVEAQYLKTLEKAWQIEDILKVQERLDRTRGEIERLQGRITYLERQVDMSTIRVGLVSESEAAVLGVVWNPLTQIKQAAYGALESLISFVYFVIKLVFVIPIVLLWAVVVGGVVMSAWKIGLWGRRRFFDQKR